MSFIRLLCPPRMFLLPISVAGSLCLFFSFPFIHTIAHFPRLPTQDATAFWKTSLIFLLPPHGSFSFPQTLGSPRTQAKALSEHLLPKTCMCFLRSKTCLTNPIFSVTKQSGWHIIIIQKLLLGWT